MVQTSRTANDPHRPDPGGYRRMAGLLGGFALFLVLVTLPPPPAMPQVAWHVAAVGVLMALWWIVEAIPIAATALLPLALFPALGVMPFQEAAAPFAHPLIFLFLGGFMIAMAMERWNLHRRLALTIVRHAGVRPTRLVDGFMAATAFLSMWVSNTATATMMLPIALSVIGLVRTLPHGETAAAPETPDADDGGFAVALLLGIAFSASIGGLATLIGTPPNALLAGFMAESYGRPIGFAQWMIVGLPVSLVLLVLAWGLLTRVLYRLDTAPLPGAEALLQRELAHLGPVQRAEWLVGLVFLLAAAGWVTRPLLNDLFPGAHISDSGIAVVAALLLFALPADLGRRTFLMDWPSTRGLPWGVLLLFGGGLSLGGAIQGTGLSEWIAQELTLLAPWPLPLVILLAAGTVMLVSHLTSNTATTAAFLPLIASLAFTVDAAVLRLTAPAVLAASCAFMMPVATPPNAIVFASGQLTVAQMVRGGALLCVIALILVVAVAYTLVPLAFGL